MLSQWHLYLENVKNITLDYKLGFLVKESHNLQSGGLWLEYGTKHVE